VQSADDSTVPAQCRQIINREESSSDDFTLVVRVQYNPTFSVLGGRAKASLYTEIFLGCQIFRLSPPRLLITFASFSSSSSLYVRVSIICIRSLDQRKELS
jgi:hypothetical protein